MLNKFLVSSTLLVLCVSSFSTSGLKSASDNRAEYTTLSSVSGYGNNDISLEPANIFQVTSKDDLDELPETGFPQIAELTIDKDINVISSDNNSIDSLENVYLNYLQEKILPAIRITNDSIATSYINYVENTCYIQDSFVITNDLISLRKLAENTSTDDFNLVYDVTQFNLNDEGTLENILYEGNKAESTIFILDGSEENLVDHINFFQKRLKTTWIQTDSSYANISRAIASGGYGVISENYESFKTILSNFSLEGRNREQYIAAHRGITSGYNENSLLGITQAATLNTDYVEIDLQITKDNQVIVCHNSQPYYTSDCDNSSKRFINMNYEDILDFTLNDQGISAGQKFPLLSELFESTKNTDLMYILEFKFDEGSADALTKDVAQYVDPIVKEYNYQNRVIGITYYRGFYSSISKYMPYMPTANLGLQGDSQYKSLREVLDLVHFFKKYNTAMDYAYNLDMVDKRYEYGFRGYSSNGYTFNDKKHLYRPMQICTTNIAEKLVSDVKAYAGPEWMTVTSSSQITDNLNLEWSTYEGAVVTLPSSIIILDGNKETDPYLTCVANYYDTTDEYGLYSPVFTISNTSLGGSDVNNIAYSNPSKTLKIDESGDIVDETETSSEVATTADESTSLEITSQTGDVSSEGNNNSNVLLISLISACVVGLGIISFVIVKKSKK